MKKLIGKNTRIVESSSRVKMHKSGKSWVRTVMSKLSLFRAMKGKSVIVERVSVDDSDNSEMLSQSNMKYLKTVLATGAIAGGGLIATTPTVEAATTTTTSTSTLVGASSVSLSTTTTGSTSTLDTTSASLSTSESVSLSIAQSISLSTSESISKSISASKSLSQSLNVSTSQSASTMASLSTSQSASNMASMSTSTSSSLSGSSTQSTTTSSTQTTSTTQSTFSNSTSTNLVSSSLSASTSTSSSLLQKSLSTSTSQSLSSSTQSSTTAVVQPTSQTFSALSVASVTSTATSTTYTGVGTDYVNNLPIYYKLVVTNTGSALQFTYTVSYDNPDTLTVEKPAISGMIQNTLEAGAPLVSYGSGYGTFNTATSYFTDSSGNKVASPGQFSMIVYSNQNDAAVLKPGQYSFQKRDMNSTQTQAGYGMVLQWSVPITNTTGDLTYTFTPFATVDNKTYGLTNFFTDTITGMDPVASTSQSTSNVASASTSASTSASELASLSASTSASTSASELASLSASTSASTS
ncbi:accessory Sec-dependent serine-rich glycoprotein adhesin, partial [Streptococcus uberis]|uniref:accessory Sec-dependent serine-rich glycoprotein adhesin n=3 Tax=Streptococcus uberis TaxID=1349 RepID=UPI0018A6E32A